METFEQGRIIWASIADLRGIAKTAPRPAMVLKTVKVSEPDDEIPVVVGTTKFVEPLRENQILIHKDYTRSPITKLNKPTVLVCDWVALVRYGDVQEKGGMLRGRQSYPIVQKVEELRLGQSR